MTFCSVMASIVSWTLSRPWPLIFSPPKGRFSVRTAEDQLTMTPPASQPVGHAQRGREVAREDRGLQAVARVVGERHGLLDAVEGDDGHDRAERLLAEDGLVDGHVGQDRGCHEGAFAGAAGYERRTGADGLLDTLDDDAGGALGDERADVAELVELVAHDELGGLLGEDAREVGDHADGPRRRA